VEGHQIEYNHNGRRSRTRDHALPITKSHLLGYDVAEGAVLKTGQIARRHKQSVNGVGIEDLSSLFKTCTLG
jgi:hypothetical protein